MWEFGCQERYRVIRLCEYWLANKAMTIVADLENENKKECSPRDRRAIVVPTISEKRQRCLDIPTLWMFKSDNSQVRFWRA